MSLATVKAAIHAQITTATAPNSITPTIEGGRMEDICDAADLDSVLNNGHIGADRLIILTNASAGFELHQSGDESVIYKTSGGIPKVGSVIFGVADPAILIGDTSTSNFGIIRANPLSTLRDWKMQNADGVIAFLSDIIPSVSNQYTTATNYTTSTTINSTVGNTNSKVIYYITAQAGALLFNNPTGSFVDGQILEIGISDNGTTRALTWGGNFEDSTLVPFPTTTPVGVALYLTFVYRTGNKFHLRAVTDMS